MKRKKHKSNHLCIIIALAWKEEYYQWQYIELSSSDDRRMQHVRALEPERVGRYGTGTGTLHLFRPSPSQASYSTLTLPLDTVVSLSSLLYLLNATTRTREGSRNSLV